MAWYESLTGRSFGDNRRFYEVFGRWRSIGITEGIHARTKGTRFVDEVPRLVNRTKAMIRKASEDGNQVEASGGSLDVYRS